MKRLVLVNYGIREHGKSSSLKKIFNILATKYPTQVNLIKNDGDILATVVVNGIMVGVETQGDPNSRMFTTLEDLVNFGCQIIVCASRTNGATCDEVIRISNMLSADLVWTTNPRTSNETIRDFLNHSYAESIVNLIENRINETY